MSVFIKNAVVKLDSVACSDEVTNVTMTPAVTTAVFTPVSGNTQQSTSPSTWTCAFSYGQNWDDPASVANTLFELEGTEGVIQFWPNGEGTGKTGWEIDVDYVPGLIGGAAGATASTATMQIKGKPRQVTTGV